MLKAKNLKNSDVIEVIKYTRVIICTVYSMSTCRIAWTVNLGLEKNGKLIMEYE
jgi:hypothetical protein